MMKLSKKSRKIIDAFDEAARDDGWTSDQGSPVAAEESEAEYIRTKEQLERHVLNLEKRIKKFKKVTNVKNKNSS